MAWQAPQTAESTKPNLFQSLQCCEGQKGGDGCCSPQASTASPSHLSSARWSILFSAAGHAALPHQHPAGSASPRAAPAAGSARLLPAAPFGFTSDKKTKKANPNPIITRHPRWGGEHRVPWHPPGRALRASVPSHPRGSPRSLLCGSANPSLPPSLPSAPAASPPFPAPPPRRAAPRPTGTEPGERASQAKPGWTGSVRALLAWSGAREGSESRGCGGGGAAQPSPSRPLTPARRPGRLLSTDIAPAADAAGAGPRSHWPPCRGGRAFRRRHHRASAASAEAAPRAAHRGKRGCRGAEAVATPGWPFWVWADIFGVGGLAGGTGRSPPSLLRAEPSPHCGALCWQPAGVVSAVASTEKLLSFNRWTLSCHWFGSSG